MQRRNNKTYCRENGRGRHGQREEFGKGAEGDKRARDKEAERGREVERWGWTVVLITKMRTSRHTPPDSTPGHASEVAPHACAHLLSRMYIWRLQQHQAPSPLPTHCPLLLCPMFPERSRPRPPTGASWTKSPPLPGCRRAVCRRSGRGRNLFYRRRRRCHEAEVPPRLLLALLLRQWVVVVVVVLPRRRRPQ